MRVKWEEVWSPGEYEKTITYSYDGEVVGYCQDTYNRPCAVVLIENRLKAVLIEDLEVLNQYGGAE